jgi:hypothetical protein
MTKFRFKIANMKQSEVSRVSVREAKALVKEVYPDAEPKFIDGWYHKGWTIAPTASRVWTGYQPTKARAWKAAANSLWCLFYFHPKEAPQ